MAIFCRFGQKRYFLEVFLDFFRNRTLLGALVFCVAFSHQGASFELLKTVFGQLFIFFVRRGVQKLPDMEKKNPKIFQTKFSNQDAKWNKKMGGRSLVITCGVIGTLYCTVE